MNYVLIAVLAILIVCTIMGFSKGIMKMIFETGALIAALLLAILISPMIAKAFQSNDTVMQSLTTKISDVMNLEELADKLPDTEEFLEGVNLPEVIKEKIVTTEFLEKLNLNETKDNMTQKLAAAISEFLAKTIIYSLSFLGVYLLATLAIFLLGKFVDLLSKVPIIKQANKLGGLALGFVEGLLLVWILFALLTAISGTAAGQTVLGYITENKFLSFLYNNNIPMNFITSQVEKLF